MHYAFDSLLFGYNEVDTDPLYLCGSLRVTDNTTKSSQANHASREVINGMRTYWRRVSGDCNQLVALDIVLASLEKARSHDASNSVYNDENVGLPEQEGVQHLCSA